VLGAASVLPELGKGGPALTHFEQRARECRTLVARKLDAVGLTDFGCREVRGARRWAGIPQRVVGKKTVGENALGARVRLDADFRHDFIAP
jgi:hypothetical protein